MPKITVKKGDTLSDLARQQGVNVSDISGFRSGDPNLIFPGENLTINKPSKEATVVSSDKGLDLVKKADKDLERIKGTKEVVDEKDIETGDEPEDFVELFNAETGQTTKINKASKNKKRVNELLDSGFEITESNTNVQFGFTGSDDDFEDEVRDVLDQFNAFGVGFRTNEEVQRQTASIEASFDARISMMRDIGRRREQSFETLGFRIGARFTGGIRGGVFGGIIAEEERQGLMRITELEGDKLAQIQTAESAARDGNWKVYAQAVAQATKSFNRQLKALTDYNKSVIKQNNTIRELQERVGREAVISDVMTQLRDQDIEFDSAIIFNLVNFTEDGQLVGDITFDEIDDIIGSFTQATKTPFSNTQQLKLEQVGLGTANRQDQLNFLFGNKGKPSDDAPDNVVIPTFDEFINDKRNALQINIFDEKAFEEQTRKEYDALVSETKSSKVDPTKNFTATTIPEPLDSELRHNITSDEKPSLAKLYDKYPDVSTGYINSLFSKLRDTSSEGTSADVNPFGAVGS